MQKLSMINYRAILKKYGYLCNLSNSYKFNNVSNSYKFNNLSNSYKYNKELNIDKYYDLSIDQNSSSKNN